MMCQHFIGRIGHSRWHGSDTTTQTRANVHAHTKRCGNAAVNVGYVKVKRGF